MVEAIKKGDTAAFELAYQQFSPRVYAYFLKKTNSPEDARDLLQTTFLKLWQYRSSLSPEFLLEQHLFQMARTSFIDHLRKENKQEKVRQAVNARIEGAELSAAPGMEFDVKGRLESALSSIPELRRKVFELNRLQGYSYREIAEMLSISVKSTDNNLTKALRQLRKLFLLLIIFFGRG